MLKETVLGCKENNETCMLNQTSSKKQRQAMAPYRLPLLDHHEGMNEYILGTELIEKLKPHSSHREEHRNKRVCV